MTGNYTTFVHSGPAVFFTESSRNIGGQELQLLQQMEELKKNNVHPILFCKPGGKIFLLAQEKNLEIISTEFRNSIDVISFICMVLAIKRYKPIAVVSHSGHDACVSALAVNASKFLFGIDLKMIRMKTYQARIPSVFSIMKMCDAMFAPSDFLRKKIIGNRAVLDTKVNVLYPGIGFSYLDSSVDDDLPQHLVQWLSSRPGPIISHGAMLRKEKGQSLIIEALPQVLAVHQDVRYIIAGEGEEKARLEELARRLHLEDHVYFAGMVSPISALLKISTLAVLPSLSEPLGMFQIESQYLGVPTLAHKVGGIVETILHQKTGLLIDPDKDGVWSSNIIWALDNVSLMREWAQKGREFVLQRFSLEKNTEELLKIINA
jgi:glycosyltransferase involved in cell wall biosynthesis